MSNQRNKVKTRVGGYAQLDRCCGTVEGHDHNKVLLRLDSGECAFAYGYSNLPEGTRALCKVQRVSRGAGQIRVSVDAVLGDECKTA